MAGEMMPLDRKLVIVCDYVAANKTHPDGTPMLANNISPDNAHRILAKWRAA